MTNSFKSFASSSKYSQNPLSKLTDFLAKEDQLELSGTTNNMRFIGYLLELGYDDAIVITSDVYKRAVGGVPRGSFLILAPQNMEGLPPHFTLLRVNSVTTTPLSQQVQQTYFELHKKSMPVLDVFTQSELQWGALKCSVLGMFYPNPEDSKKISFSGDVNNVVSAHRYKVFSPNQELLDLIVNGIVRSDNNFTLGKLRMTECLLFSEDQKETMVKISVKDFCGARTAMFGKTRLGKSNTVKLIAKSILDLSDSDSKIGQLIFDVNGEYANDNQQNKSLKSAYPDKSIVYAIVKRNGTESESLKINFYENPSVAISVLTNLMELYGTSNAQYIKAFTSVSLPDLGDIKRMDRGDQTRAFRKVQMLWAILYGAGFICDESRLRKAVSDKEIRSNLFDFNPSQQIVSDVFDGAKPPSGSLSDLSQSLKKIGRYVNENGHDGLKSTSSGKQLFDPDDLALLAFLAPKMASSGGVVVIKPFSIYHDSNAGNVEADIVNHLVSGKTVILDLGSVADVIRKYFSDLLSKAVFRKQEDLFTSNSLGDNYIQLYFEEAHNLFPRDSKSVTDIYSRFAKEGAKFHIGMVYSTQSPSTISQELLAQTENFFVGHLSSQDEARSLARVQIQFEEIQDDILRCKTTGYMRMLTQSHRYVIPVQIDKFENLVSAKDVNHAV
jgi:DNA helicase HerA-like ATPase